ncbi:hypothetical protein FSB75_21490 [Flavisolibacter ginsenosidimutans]|uniref:DUF1376 domain-containing protein n=1 Tax=Flavisolibacter ginsenosidimutans TaxID=661481 RepID=A0A5B8UQ76_9BACT|nr:hypothetical protein FSB75_21490 [Flavisolibacter ginsenosidimutans]
MESKQFSDFFEVIENDPRINTTHVSLYMALLLYWKAHEFAVPLQVFSHEVMPLAKILSSTTYHQRLKDLNDFGYIRYEASYKRNVGSKIYLQMNDLRIRARTQT